MSETTSVGTILSVEEKNLVRKSDNTPFVLYKIKTHPLGELSTTKRDIYNQAAALVDHAVLLTYSETAPNEQGYINRYLNKVGLAAQAPTYPEGHQQGTNMGLQPSAASVSVQNASIGRDEAIWRQTATKTAASFNNKDLAEYWERVQMLLDFYRTGVVPGVAQDEQTALMPSQNTFVPPAPGDLINPDVSDDDIPF